MITNINNDDISIFKFEQNPKFWIASKKNKKKEKKCSVQANLQGKFMNRCLADNYPPKIIFSRL